MLKSYEECYCDCHSDSDVEEKMVHCSPCCYKCTECGKNISELYYNKHLNSHKIQKEKINQYLMEE